MNVSTAAELEAIVNYQDYNSKHTRSRGERAVKKMFKRQASKARRSFKIDWQQH